MGCLTQHSLTLSTKKYIKSSYWILVGRESTFTDSSSNTVTQVLGDEKFGWAVGWSN